MPFDGADTQTTNRAKLIRALRGPKPDWWNYAYCNRCAMELAVRLGIAERAHNGIPSLHELAKALGLSIRAAHRVFLAAKGATDCGLLRITPSDVADELESAT